MIINLPPEQEARLAALAARDGRKIDDLAQEAITRLLDDDARFTEAVQRGIAAADRGDFVASEEVGQASSASCSRDAGSLDDTGIRRPPPHCAPHPAQ
jgi:predicted transcriptional regulator